MSSSSTLLSPAQIGSWPLKNRVVMAPMTRSRASEGSVPNALNAEYYGQRAEAGLIITEGTSPSPNGVGYARIPGIWSAAQVEGWKPVTAAVHAKGSHILVQLMHTGRVGHTANLPKGAEVLAPSPVQTEGQQYTDSQGMQPFTVPREMTPKDIATAIEEFVTASKNAIAAGFDGVELHGANGYLLEQFISPQTNQRTDAYGGSIPKRLKFVLEVTNAVAAAIGKDKVGIRLSPYGQNAGMKPYPEIEETYGLLVKELAATGIQYLHLVDHASMGAPPVPEALKASIHAAWPRTFIASGGFDRPKAEAALEAKKGDLIAFGRPFIANPDFVTRIDKGIALANPDFATFYTPGPKGYTDYPAAS